MFGMSRPGTKRRPMSARGSWDQVGGTQLVGWEPPNNLLGLRGHLQLL
jgi:hypothetical protein